MRGNMMAERARRGLTRKQVADVIGVSEQSIYRWEKGDKFPGGDKLLALADFYGVEPGYLTKSTPDHVR